MGVEKDLQPDREGERVAECSHWVAELFPPHFTMLDFLKDRRHSSGTLQSESDSAPMLPSETLPMARGRRKQAIYWSALEEVQQREGKRRKEQLAQRMVRKEEQEKEMDHGDTEYSSMASRHGPGEEKEAGRIWNEKDLAALRWGVREVERDRRRLSAQLQRALAQVEEQWAERRQLQGLLEERESQLSRARREAAWQSQRLEALRTQCRDREEHCKAWAAEARSQAEEAGRVQESLRRAEEEVQELREEKKDLAREAEALKRQLELEQQEWETAVRANNEAALQGIQRELELARAELEAERQRHARSRMALELLRKHYNSQSEQRDQRHADEVTYM